MCAEQEQANGYSQQKLLRGCILILVVNLLPHVEVVVGTGIELEGDAANVVKHQVRGEHVGGVGEGPGGFLRDGWYDVVQDFQESNENWMDEPSTCSIDILARCTIDSYTNRLW